MRVLDLFCDRWGWSRAFAARGWECVGVDLQSPPDVPKGCKFVKGDILEIKQLRGIPRGTNDYSFGESWDFASTSQKDYWIGEPFDFIVASSPCEEFSVHGMKHFHPNPKYPEMGIKLFNHTRSLCEASGVPYVMENVRAAQQFVGNAVHHLGPFYLWGNAVPPLLTTGGIKKGIDVGSSKVINAMTTAKEKRDYRSLYTWNRGWSRSKQRSEDRAEAATIPPELANCVAAYAERLLEQRAEQRPLHREAAK